MNLLTLNPSRLITGLVLLGLLGGALYLGGPFLFGLLMLISLLGVWEFYAMFWTGREGMVERVLGLLLTAGLGVLAWLYPDAGVLPFSAAFLVLCLFFLVRWSRNTALSFVGTATVAAGLAYVPLLLLPALRLTGHEQLLLVCVTICSDTAAYFAGVRFGKRKIWPKVSPGKSVEGSIGGLAAAIAICVVLGLSFGSAGLSSFILLGLILGIMAQFGDFFESALKRAHGVKDSGRILPGHGGVLDRIDSLLFVVPTYMLCRAFETFF